MFSKIFKILGYIFLVFAVVLFILIFFPVLKEEIKYTFNINSKDKVVYIPSQSDTNSKENKKFNENIIVPADLEFAITVPKINANSKVIPNVSPFDSTEYQKELTKGVAHAEGSVYPGQIGNTFLFAHSSDNFYNANRYNSVFYLLNKLKQEDEFYLTYKGEIYKYKVSQTKVVNPDQVEYLNSIDPGGKTATLMTCWPAGTTSKRLLVIGELSE